MLDDIRIVAIVIIAIWILVIAYYFYTSRQQDKIRRELDALRAKLDQEDEGES